MDRRASIALIALTSGLVMTAIAYFHIVLDTSSTVTHLCYLPIVLAALWFRRKGTMVPIILFAYLVALDIITGEAGFLMEDLLRGTIFTLIGALLGFMSERVYQMGRRLEEANKELEVKVEARTNDLGWVNEELLQELKARQEIEAHITAEKERLLVTLSSIGDAVITTDARGRITMMNPSAEQMLDYKSKEAMGRPIQDVVHLRIEGTNELVTDPIGRALTTRHPIHLKDYLVQYRPDGTRRLVIDSAAPILVNDELLGAVLVLNDVTELEHMREEALKVDSIRSMELLAGGIAHDFNNMLTAISGRISMASQGLDPSSFSAVQLQEAEKGIGRASALTRQLATFSRTGSPVKGSAHIGELLVQSTDFVLTNSKVNRVFEVMPDLWPVAMDSVHIGQIITNLVINAKESMGNEGTIRVGAENLAVPEGDPLPLKPGRYVRMVIKDEGVGIPPEKLKQIFEPYFTTKPYGSGLGLAIVRSIIMKHGGLIRVESYEGQGTTFELFIPAAH